MRHTSSLTDAGPAHAPTTPAEVECVSLRRQLTVAATGVAVGTRSRIGEVKDKRVQGRSTVRGPGGQPVPGGEHNGSSSDAAYPQWDEPDHAVDDAVRDVIAHLSDLLVERAGLKAQVEGHVVTEASHHTLVEHGPAGTTAAERVSHTRDWSFVVDLMDDTGWLADADTGWSGPFDPKRTTLVPRLRQALERHALRHTVVPPIVHLELVEGSAGALLHEAVGHLLENYSGRRSLLRHRHGQQVAPGFLSVVDDPTRAGAFGQHEVTALGSSSSATSLIDGGRLSGFLHDEITGPWRQEIRNEAPKPRMTWLGVAPGRDAAALDDGRGRVHHPLVRVHRFGGGSLNHRTGIVNIDVKEAVTVEGSPSRVAPFSIIVHAADLLADLQAVGPDLHTWSAYCLGTSGRLPVGAEVPTILTGAIRTGPARWLAP